MWKKFCYAAPILILELFLVLATVGGITPVSAGGKFRSDVVPPSPNLSVEAKNIRMSQASHSGIVWETKRQRTNNATHRNKRVFRQAAPS